MPDEAAYAANWKRILLVDALIGLAAVGVGVRSGGVWLVLAGAGVVYVGAVFRRFLRWRRLRRAAQG